MTTITGTEGDQTIWQAAEAYQRRLLDLCEPPAGQPLNQPALAAAAEELSQVLAALRSALGDLPERQRAEAALEKHLQALTHPPGDTSDLHFEDLFNLEEVQRIQDAFAEATGVASIITDIEGRPITRPSNFCRLCQDIIRQNEQGLKNCFAEAALDRTSAAGPTIQLCLSGGLWNSGASICVGDRPVANWLIGQVLDDEVDEVAMLRYAREIGVDESEFQEALAEVTRMPKAQFAKISQTLFLIAQQLSRQALQNIQHAREITHRQQAADTLRASEARYRDLFENSPISLWEEDFSEVKAFLDDLRRQGVTDLQAYLAANPDVVHEGMRRIKVLDVNQATLKLYGAQTKQELLENVERVLGPLTYPIIVDELTAIEGGATEFEAPGVNHKLTGEVIEVALRWLIPSAQEQSLARLIVSIEDVTQQHRAEAALRESEARFRAYIEHSPEGIFVTNAAGRYLDANQAACDLVGYTRGELLLLNMKDLVPLTDDRQSARLNELATAGSFSGELRLMRKAGTTLPVSLNAVRLPDDTLLAFCTDITERQRAEIDLRTSEERYRVLAEALPDLIYILDRQHRLQYVNAQAGHMLGRPPHELVGLPQAVLFPADTSRDHDLNLEQVFSTGQALNTEERLPLPGREVWIDNRLTPLRDAAGEIVGILGIARDVTERKTMEQALREERALLARRVAERTAELNAANAELVRAMRAKDDFLATMSHELRTPLTGILGLSESMQMGIYGAVTDKQARSLQMIHTSGEHLLALITDVLDLAKIGAEKLELQLGWVAAADVCQASLRLIHPQANKKRIRVVSRFDSAVNNLWADSRRLKQMLLNLLGNAVKFTPEGGTIGLEVTGDSERQQALFTIWDTGIGISTVDLQRLFQPFMQVESSLSRRYEGAGLGLALVRQLAELHGGGVMADSQEGQGSRFTIVLPWQPADRRNESTDQLFGSVGAPPAPPAGLSSPSAEAALSEAPAKLLLLAEDNELLARAFMDSLQGYGYEVVLARDGIEALELAQLRRPALILMDIQMPGLDGLDAIRRLRTDPVLGRTPVIALTALTMPGDRERCLAAGANDYVSKPIKWAELLRKVKELLQA